MATVEAQQMPPSTVYGSGQIGHAFSTEGTVTGEIQSKDFPIQSGTPVYLDEWVRTRERSQSGFRFHDQSRLDVGPRSRVKLDKQKYDPSKRAGSITLRLGSGQFKFHGGNEVGVKEPIKTPYGTMLVKPAGQ